MALVKRVSKIEAAGEKEKLALAGIVPEYEWQTTAGDDRSGIKLHYISYLPERADGEKQQPAQVSGFCDGFTDPTTGTVRSGKNCVALRVTGASGVALAKRMAGAVVLAETGSAKAALEAMDSFDANEPWLVKTGSMFVDTRDNAEAEVLRGEDHEMVALYAAGGALSGRVLYAPPVEFEEGFE